ncbi:MAG: hypothetical protein E6J78_10110 [Deltaproteobacteria bacterium]|nr:MAG: hypothetical protein E6J78_10110 [Deltaproteobacteria bacterium]
MRLSALLVLAAACGNPDNLVLGGISATATIPVASIDNVRSAISGIVTLNDANGNRIGQKVAIILTNTSGLCTQLGSSPDYFQNPPQDYVALILLTPLDQVGFFYFGRDPVAALVIPAAKGVKPATRYPAVNFPNTYIADSDLSGTGGNARGSFDIAVVDSFSQVHEFYGRFKTGSCDALANVIIAMP